MTRPPKQGTVLVVGCGGLGGPAALALAAEGVPAVLCDPDRVELSNLHRQVQFGPDDVGAPKAEVLRRLLIARGADSAAISARDSPFAPGERLPDGCLAVFDGSDNFTTKFAVNDAAVAAGRPAVIASALRVEGQIACVWPGGPCYRCLFESVPDDEEAGSCANAGILGPLLASVAGRAVQELLGMLRGEAPAAPLITLSDIHAPWRAVGFHRRPGCSACGCVSGYHGPDAGPPPRESGSNHREV